LREKRLAQVILGGLAPACSLIAPLLALSPAGVKLQQTPAMGSGKAGAQALAALGEKLFFDRRLSSDGTVSCATCHQPEKAFTDGRRVAVGVAGSTGTRNTPTLLDAALSKTFFWDGRRDSLEAQVGDPFVNAGEHGLADHGVLIALIAQDSSYAERFAKAFRAPAARDVASVPRVRQAIAAYIATLRAGESAFDRYAYHGDGKAITGAERRGLDLFRGRGHCTDCHLIGPGSAPLTDGEFHSSVLRASVAEQLPALTKLVMSASESARFALVSKRSDVAALGRFIATLNPVDIGKFRTPTLRNAALTGPYLHDGSAATLAQAIEREAYRNGARDGRPLILTPAEIEDLVQFLNALTSDSLRGAQPDHEMDAKERSTGEKP
jgi:cytochrome c peroxidase